MVDEHAAVEEVPRDVTLQGEILAKLLLESTEQIVKAMPMLREKKNLPRIKAYTVEINRLENESDRLSRTLIAQLFGEEKDPLQVIKWKEIIEVIETAVDKCEDVANVIETVTLKSA